MPHVPTSCEVCNALTRTEEWSSSPSGRGGIRTGRCTFTSRFNWLPGRRLTSQLYFPENLNDDVLAQPPYSNRGMRNRRNDNDPVLRSRDLDALQMTVIPTAIGYRAWHTIGIRS